MSVGTYYNLLRHVFLAKISIEIERWPDKNMQDTLTCGDIKKIAVGHARKIECACTATSTAWKEDTHHQVSDSRMPMEKVRP